jgi:hypothetical protein
LRKFKPFLAAEQPSVIPVDTQATDVVEHVSQEIRARCTR